MHRNSAVWCHLTRQVLKELIPRFKGDAAESTSAGYATPRHTRSLRHHGLVCDCVRSTRRLGSGRSSCARRRRARLPSASGSSGGRRSPWSASLFARTASTKRRVCVGGSPISWEGTGGRGGCRGWRRGWRRVECGHPAPACHPLVAAVLLLVPVTRPVRRS